MKYLILIASMVALTSCSSLIDYNGSKYKFITETVSWNEAKILAEESGGHLATFASMEELAYIKSQLPTASIFWVGLSDSEYEGTWKWIDGEDLHTSMRGNLEVGPDSQTRDYAHMKIQRTGIVQNDRLLVG